MWLCCLGFILAFPLLAKFNITVYNEKKCCFDCIFSPRIWKTSHQVAHKLCWCAPVCMVSQPHTFASIGNRWTRAHPRLVNRLPVHLQRYGPAPWRVEARVMASFGCDLGRHGKAGRLWPTASPGPSPSSAPLTGVRCSALPVRKVKHTCSLCAPRNKQAHNASTAAPPGGRGLLWLQNSGYL